MTNDSQAVIDATRRWLEKAVIGLNLCPFARAPYLAEQVHFQVSDATTAEALLEDLVTALQVLADTEAELVETTLLIHPGALPDFEDFNDFLAVADAVLEAMGLTGTLQIASFHPDYRFADCKKDSIENYTNRSPYPILHLLRESSVSRAVDAMADPDAIYRSNIETLKRLGKEGWKKL